ncbi:hypothetical protein [Streptomyces sp. SAS_272]|uniref:hypothetical protein n=1 Tax=Streptomyces sp. SAS_272 TaxID=3412747 RepID=UPI00403D07F1
MPDPGRPTADRGDDESVHVQQRPPLGARTGSGAEGATAPGAARRGEDRIVADHRRGPTGHIGGRSLS